MKGFFFPRLFLIVLLSAAVESQAVGLVVEPVLVRAAIDTLDQSGDTLFSTSGFEPVSIGYQVTTLANISVLSLGFFDLARDGLNSSQSLGIFSLEGTLLAQATIQSSSFLRGDFRYQNLNQALYFEEGASFRVVQFPTNDPWVFRAGVNVFDPALIYDGSFSASGSPSDLSFPTRSGGTRREYLGSSFEFVVVPEPSTSLVLIAAFIPWFLSRKR